MAMKDPAQLLPVGRLGVLDLRLVPLGRPTRHRDQVGDDPEEVEGGRHARRDDGGVGAHFSDGRGVFWKLGACPERPERALLWQFCRFPISATSSVFLLRRWPYLRPQGPHPQADV